MLGAERLRIQRRVGDWGGRLRLQRKAAPDRSRLLLRPRERRPERQKGNDKHDADAHDLPPNERDGRPTTPRGLSIDDLIPRKTL